MLSIIVKQSSQVFSILPSEEVLGGAFATELVLILIFFFSLFFNLTFDGNLITSGMFYKPAVSITSFDGWIIESLTA